MANKTWKAVQVKIDGASATIVDFTAYLNNAVVSGSHATLEDSGFGVEESTFQPGISGATVSINGWVNSTTEAAFGPLVGNYTSLTKTVGVYNGVKWLTGEAYPGNVQFSNSVPGLGTFSADFTYTGALTRTSVAPA